VEIFGRLTRAQECERILQTVGDHPHDIEPIFTTLGLQFRLLHNRAQVLLAICGVLISTSVLLMTGKLVGQPVLDHRTWIVALLITAGITEIVAAMVVVALVLRLRWMTELPGEDVRAWVMTSLRYRDSKRAAFRVSSGLLLLSMTCFVAASTIAWLEMG
jgi:hypothetical protein